MLQAISWHSRSCHRIWNSSLREQSQRKMWSAEACLFLEWGGEASQQPNALPSIVSSHVSQWCPSSFNIFGMILEDEEAVFRFSFPPLPSLWSRFQLHRPGWKETACLTHLTLIFIFIFFLLSCFVLLSWYLMVSSGILIPKFGSSLTFLDLLGTLLGYISHIFTEP